MTPILAFLLALVCILVPQGVIAQPEDGTILSRDPVLLADDAPDAARSALDGVILERVVYSSDGLEVEAFLARPSDGESENLPCVIFNRGGNRDFGAITPVRAAYLLARIAKRGYVVVASNYRGNGVFGAAKYPGEHECSEGDRIGGVGREEFGGADVHDVLALIPMLSHVDHADTSRIGLFGWSRGGMMTYLALKSTNRFKAAIVGAGLADLAQSIAERPGMEEHVYSELIPGWSDPATQATAIEARSAVRWVDELSATTPILILHGTADWRVSPKQALAMAQTLQAARHPYRLIMFEGGDHGLSEHREEVSRVIDDWLDHYVRDGKTWPSLEPHGN